MAADSVIERQQTEDAALKPVDVDAGLLELGPIDWDLFRPQLAELEAMPEVDSSDLAILVYAVPRIAAHHGQELPPEVAGFVARYAHLASQIKLRPHD